MTGLLPPRRRLSRHLVVALAGRIVAEHAAPRRHLRPAAPAGSAWRGAGPSLASSLEDAVVGRRAVRGLAAVARHGSRRPRRRARPRPPTGPHPRLVEEAFRWPVPRGRSARAGPWPRTSGPDFSRTRSRRCSGASSRSIRSGVAPWVSPPEEGVVDEWGRVHGHPDLHVADGSVMPGPVGPNPSLTIAALANRFADRMIDDMKDR